MRENYSCPWCSFDTEDSLEYAHPDGAIKSCPKCGKPIVYETYSITVTRKLIPSIDGHGYLLNEN